MDNQEQTAKKIDSLRENIDRIDEQIMNLLAARFDLVREMARVKDDAGVLIYDRGREFQIEARTSVKRYSTRVGPIMLYILQHSRLEMYELLESETISK